MLRISYGLDNWVAKLADFFNFKCTQQIVQNA